LVCPHSEKLSWGGNVRGYGPGEFQGRRSTKISQGSTVSQVLGIGQIGLRDPKTALGCGDPPASYNIGDQ
jgi:hypothetical protein